MGHIESTLWTVYHSHENNNQQTTDVRAMAQLAIVNYLRRMSQLRMFFFSNRPSISNVKDWQDVWSASTRTTSFFASLAQSAGSRRRASRGTLRKGHVESGCNPRSSQSSEFAENAGHHTGHPRRAADALGLVRSIHVLGKFSSWDRDSRSAIGSAT